MRLQAFGGTRLARRHNGVSLAHEADNFQIFVLEEQHLGGGWFNKDAMLVLTEEVLKSGRTPAIAETAQLLE